VTLPIRWLAGIWFSNSGSMGASIARQWFVLKPREGPTRLPVIAMALIFSVSASMPRCTLRHCLGLEDPCFLAHHSPSP